MSTPNDRRLIRRLREELKLAREELERLREAVDKAENEQLKYLLAAKHLQQKLDEASGGTDNEN